MKWKGTLDDPEFADGPIDDVDDADEYPVWEKQKKFSVTEALFKKIELPLILMAAGLVLIIVVFAVTMTGDRSAVDLSRIDALEQRLAAFEDRLTQLAVRKIPAEPVGGQNQGLDALKLRVSNLETAVTARMDRLSSDLSKLSREAAAAAPETPAPRKPAAVDAPAEKTVYHRVRSGDTLYGIGRRYGVSVAELIEWNGISRGKAIYPGQKLIVGGK